MFLTIANQINNMIERIADTAKNDMKNCNTIENRSEYWCC